MDTQIGRSSVGRVQTLPQRTQPELVRWPGIRAAARTVIAATVTPTTALAELLVLKNGSLLGLGEAGATILVAP